MKKDSMKMLLGGIIIGFIGVLLQKFGNPGNMGICIACFLRDIAGALNLHQAAVVQYIRPEIIGIVFGAFFSSIISNDFKSRGGSNPLIRFIFGMIMMIGALVFLGCPLRLILRLSAGDLNALIGLFGFIFGIFVGVILLKKGFSLGKSQEQSNIAGFIMPIFATILLIFILIKPEFISFSKEGPGANHAPVIYSLIGGIIVGIILQRTRICSVAAFRDVILIKNYHYLIGILGIFIGAFGLNLILNYNSLNFGFENQPIAHNDHLWNFLSLSLVGLTGSLLGGCPIRQIILSSDGDNDAAITVMGLIFAAALSHNFKLASSAEGSTMNGQIAVILCLIFVLTFALTIINKNNKKI
ncbi:MAG: YedE family putative selenium transporter [Tissierellia bacterium]|nr:YedE family putative selenium transporter [Tissierellia bacterium]